MDSHARIKELRTLLNLYSNEYYSLSISSISDAEYDRLYLELVELERAHPELADSHSPTQRIGAPSKSAFQKVKHAKRMLSLDNMRTAKDVIHYLGTEEVVIEPKIDGASLELIYYKGRLKQAITRGDGTVGDDVTLNARAIPSVPLILSTAATVTVRGEVYMTYTAFNKLNERFEAAGEEVMANPRNAAAGTLKLKDPKEVAARGLSFVAYDTVDEFLNFTQHQLADHLSILGFTNVSLLPVTQSCQTVADCFLIENEESLAQRIAEADVCRKFLDLPTDGLVFKLNDRAKQRELGEGNKYPKWGCAFKFPAERKETRLNAVTVQIGRTGRVTPVAELEPVLLSGTVVRRASLCNQDEIKRLNIDIGDTVLVEKSAEIIPKVVGVSQKAGSSVYKLPAKCPCCKSDLVTPEGFVDAYCQNDLCYEQVVGRLIHGCGKSALDIDGCGEVLVKELVANGATRLSDVFTIDPSFMKAAARKRFEAGREAAKAQPLWRKLHALGIDGFGTQLCQEVANTWISLEQAFAEPAKSPTLKDVVGESVYNSIVDYCLKFSDEIDALDSLIGLVGTARAVGPLTGKTFCITGNLMAGTRPEVALLIENAGGVVKSSVGRNLDYLIKGTDTGKAKLAAAEKYGIAVIEENQLFELMGQEMPTPKDVEVKEY